MTEREELLWATIERGDLRGATQLLNLPGDTCRYCNGQGCGACGNAGIVTTTQEKLPS